MQKQCTKCGAMANADDKYCTVCGAILQQQKQTQQSDTTMQTDTKLVSFENYLLMFLIAVIPIVNIVVLCMWAFGREENENRKNFAKAALIFVGIGTVVAAVMAVFLFRMIWYGITYGLDEYDLYKMYHDNPMYDYDVPDGECWRNIQLQDEPFSTVDSDIKQILIEENGVVIL